MSNWIEDIATYLRAEAIAGVGNNVFAFGMPENVPLGIAVIPPVEGIAVDADITNLNKGVVSLVSRASKPQTSYDILAVTVPSLIMGETAWANMNIKYSRLIAKPQVFPKSDGGYYEAVANFMICFTDTRI